MDMVLLLRHGRVAKYCHEYVCLFVCLSAHSHNSKTARPNFTKFLCMLPVLVARPSSDGVERTALRYITYFRFYGWRHFLYTGTKGGRP